ncbi:MAG TPA: hypothetical protein VFH54_02065 [Mycobacteriales bacterium]|nr:hypothetical protein [Mycobacteriales bacterium]
MTSAAAPRRVRRPGRTSGLLNFGIVIAVLAVLLPLLLNAATSAPPTAAEFSPNASQVIKQAPPGEAASVNGQGGGTGQGAGAGAKRPTPTPTPAQTQNIPQNLLKNCVGPPPDRQIEDPQSPPCIRYWVGNNGGATSQGVTKDAIYVAVPTPNGFTTEYAALQNFFNNRFEFYGRRLIFEYCTPKAGSGSQGSGDQANQTADAATAAAGCGGPKPFASTFYQFDNGRYYNQVMACRYKVVTVGSWQPFDTSYMNQCAPYFYNYPMDAQDIFSRIGDWSCARLVSRDAVLARGTAAPGKPALNTTKRNFGIFLAPYTADDPVARRSALNGLVDRLRQCGANVPEKQIIINPVGAASPGVSVDPASANNAIVQMKQANVSTIICLCATFPFGALAKAASSNSYHPEWIGSTYGGLDQVVIQELAAAPADETRALFGLTFVPRQINPLLEPYNAAFEEGDPSLGPQTKSTDYSNFTQVYRPLLMLASGLQMAGPHLTPQAFLAGLRKTAFPNPLTSTHAGAVDVPQNGYSFTRDAAEWYWSNTAKGPYSDDQAAAKGAICYIDGGARHDLGTWPHNYPNYGSGPCDSG